MVFPEGFPLSQILPIEFIVDQHEFVAKCYANYAELGLEPGNPDDGEWQDAHYPAPDPEGDKTIPLLYNDHQQQGLYQSEEYNRVCFWVGHTRKFLTQGPFVENWFELWDLYDKWVGERLSKVHERKDELGRSLVAMKSNGKAHAEKDKFGRSVTAVKAGAAAHTKKDELGRSVNGVKTAERLHEKKDEFGRSIHAMNSVKRMHEATHAEKDEFGRSINAVKAGKRNVKKMNSQRWQCTKTGYISTPGPLSRWQKARNIDTKHRRRLPDSPR